MRLMDLDASALLADGVDLNAVAFRPIERAERAEIEWWPAPCAAGSPLPATPLRLTGDLFVPVDFEATYHEACKRRRLI
jgi:hypothetical protein